MGKEGFVHVNNLSIPALAVGIIILPVTVTASVAEQPLAVFVTVSVYVFGNVAVGCAIVGSSKPAAGLHEYVLPATAAEPILTPLHVNTLSTPAFAIGGVILVETFTISVD